MADKQTALSRWIKERRERIPALTQVRLAERVKRDPATVSRWERGELEPGIGDLNALCDVFGVSADEVLALLPKQAEQEAKAS